jgi:hypothetical protein
VEVRGGWGGSCLYVVVFFRASDIPSFSFCFGHRALGALLIAFFFWFNGSFTHLHGYPLAFSFLPWGKKEGLALLFFALE